MLEFYNLTIEVYDNNMKKISSNSGFTRLCNTKPEDEIHHITWDNLEKYNSPYNVYLPFIWGKKRRGRYIYFLSGGNRSRTIKEWKESINLIIKYKYTKKTVSINYVLNWHNGDEAIKYLTERGLNIVNKSQNCT